MSKQEAVIEVSTQLINEFAKTGSMKSAFDSVFGEGAYEKFAGELYDQLRAAQ